MNVSWFLRMSPFLNVQRLEFALHVVGLVQQAGLDHLIDVGAREGQAGLEAALDLREVFALVFFISPSTASMSSCEVTTTQARPRQIVPSSSVIVCRLSIRCDVGADELPDLIDQEEEAVLRPLRVQVLLDPFAEVLDGQREVVLGTVDPLLRGVLALPERLGKGLRPPHPG